MSLVVLFPAAGAAQPPQAHAVALSVQPTLRAGYARQLTLKRMLVAQSTLQAAYARKLSLRRALIIATQAQTALRDSFVMLRALTTTPSMAVVLTTLKTLVVVAHALYAGFAHACGAHTVRTRPPNVN